MIQVGYVLLLCIVANTAGAVAPAAKGCVSTFKAATNFDAAKFAGIWYEVRQIFPTPGREGSCGTAKYTAVPDGSLKVDITWLDLKSKVRTESGTIKKAGAKTVGGLAVTIGNKSNEYTIFHLTYSLIFGVYACVGGKPDVWVFSKKQSVTDAELAPIKTAMTSNGLDATTLKTTARQNCPTVA